MKRTKYAADGRKLQENVASGSLLSRRDYVGDFIYETGVLKRILFEGGYADTVPDLRNGDDRRQEYL